MAYEAAEILRSYTPRVRMHLSHYLTHRLEDHGRLRGYSYDSLASLALGGLGAADDDPGSDGGSAAIYAQLLADKQKQVGRPLTAAEKSTLSIQARSAAGQANRFSNPTALDTFKAQVAAVVPQVASDLYYGPPGMTWGDAGTAVKDTAQKALVATEKGLVEVVRVAGQAAGAGARGAMDELGMGNTLLLAGAAGLGLLLFLKAK